MFCEEHAVVQPASPAAGYSPYSNTYSAPYTPAAPQGPSPGLAFLLGLIPGVGAIYNAQYAKGVVHVLILGLLFSLVDHDQIDGLGPLLALMIPLWFFYMAFEAYHTALKRQRGEVVDEFSSVFPVNHRRFPVGPVLLIAVGFILLLNTLGLFPMRVVLLYGPPVFLIALGCYLLYVRLAGTPAPAEHFSTSRVPGEEVRNEN
ncbi:MAG TPA: hypothetical protein VEQ63_03020 [Bryobacteraceae bacterium]|nr:hypothetical protein [Bryobacteraceae bacterium]